ncbi:DNA polymerase III subunit alpha [Chloroflexota bacterium]
MFTHLHVHSEYSLLDGMCRVPQLIRKSQEMGMESLAITDHGTLHGIINFYLEAKAAGIKPILGCEVYVAPQSLRSKGAADKTAYHLVLLAKDKVGYHNIIELVTTAHLEGFYYKPRVDKDLLCKHHQGLIALSACPSGEVGRLILEERIDESEKAAEWYKEVFDDFYLELQAHDMPELARINKELVSMGSRLNIPLVATNDVHYINKDDSYAHEILLCIQTNNTIHNEKRPKMPGDSFYLKSPQEMTDLFSELPKALSNTERIAELCELTLEFDKLHLPEVELASGKTADDILTESVYAGLATRYPNPSSEVTERLKYELEVIRSTQFANYFLVVWDVISFAKQQNIMFGVRGSAAASLTLYCLGITDTDPLAQRLVFERFLNVERKEMPDIDLDFQDNRRQEVISYVAQKYGSDRVAQIITFGTMGARAVLRDVGRALALPYAEVDRLVRQIPASLSTIDEALEASLELHNSYRSDDTVKHLLDTARKLEGVARHASTHAAGIVISKEPLVNLVPLQRPSKAGQQDLYMTQLAMGDIAKIGLLKMDFLGLANLTILAEATKTITETRGIDIDLRNIPLDDDNTFKILSSGETTGIFQLESTGMRHFIKELKPNTFSDLAAMVALYRPGPKEHIPTFIRAKHGLEPIHFPHPNLANILEETYGVIVYQDQVLHIVQAFAGYSLGEADIVRKAMGKKIPEVMRKEKQKFLFGARKNGFSKELANQVWNLIEPFAGYAFNKAHSVSYALIAYQTAYLKANYATEFMSALLTIRMEQQESVTTAIAECQRLGIKVLPPDINHSRDTFTIEQDASGLPAIRFGLAAIKNVGVAGVKTIIAAREEGNPFNSIEDFCRRADLKSLNKRMLESLIKVGALDSLGERGSLLAGIDRIMSLAQHEQRLKENGQTTMFDLWGHSVDVPLPGIELPKVEIISTEKLAWEKELLGVYFSDHPLGYNSQRLAAGASVFCAQINEEMEEQLVDIVGIVTSMRQLLTRNKRPFISAVIDDFSGSIEAIAWPEVYQRSKELWMEGNTLLIKGKVKIRAGRIQLTCNTISPYQPKPEDETDTPTVTAATFTRRRYLQINLTSTNDTDADTIRLSQIFALLKQFPGEDEVYLAIVDDEDATKLEVPNLATNYCPELSSLLINLVGEQGFALKENK